MGSNPIPATKFILMEKVKVVFQSGETGEIYLTEYEANKDKGFIAGLYSEKELVHKVENKELKKKLKTK